SGDQLWQKNLATGVQTLLNPEVGLRMTGSLDGRKLFFRKLTGSHPQAQTIISVDSNSGRTATVCENCGAPSSVSPHSDFVAYETGSRVTRIGMFDTRNGQKQDILSHPYHATENARFSPDGSWLAFELNRGIDGKQIIVAPFRGLTEVPES